MNQSGENQKHDILIVEDSRTQAEQLRLMLEQHRFATRVARNGVEALMMLKQRKPILVISDINMPEMDGYELCRRIRADPAIADLPVILLTALSEPDDVILGLECGADNFVLKPPDESYLLSRVRYIMANQHLRAMESTRISLEIQLGGRKHLINADRLQVLHLLLSTYESAVLRGKQLALAQEELRRVNETLEEKVRERTAALTSEVAERRASEERFQKLFHASPIGMGLAQADGRVLEINGQLTEFLGYARSELVGRNVADLPAVWADDQERAIMLDALQQLGAVRNQEVRCRRKSGEIRTSLVSIEPLTLVETSMYLVSVVDITDRKALEAELQRFHRTESVGRLASGIAHDMNNILAPIMMSAPLLRMKLAPDEDEKILSTIEISAQRGAALVRQLLIFGRGVEVVRQPLDPAGVVSEIVKICRQTFPRNITIEPILRDNTRMVHGDPTQLHQVLLNIALNARDAMTAAGGRLTIQVDDVELDAQYAAQHKDVKPGHYILFRLSDTGVGIAPDVAEHIFDPFFTTKEVGKGTGLGLSTVLGIIRSHSGFVRLKSEVGQGATFEVYLPASREREGTKIESGDETPRGNGEVVMVVDDEDSIRNVLRNTLVRHNYNVVSAQNGVEATGVFAANPSVELVITDLDMPLMDGVNLARVLLRMKPSLKFLISTGVGGLSGAEKVQKDLESLGIQAVLIKPYSAEKLLHAVHALLHESRPPSGG